VPVWHERTRAAVEAGKLALVGITQEQHRDRCALFAQWQGLDWPILWDPVNRTEAPVVPVAIAVDEHGIVRSVDLTLERLDEFLAASHEDDAPASEPAELGIRESNRGPDELEPGTVLDADAATSRLLWSARPDAGVLGPADFAACIDALDRARAAEHSPPSAAFRLGVALRLRHDSPAAQPQDFQASLDRWGEALRADPTQYIWRRRIQQWGPRLDKPYPFYGWIEEATREVRARGETPVVVRVPLTSSELAGREPIDEVGAEREHPDPRREVPRDRDGLVTIGVAVAPHTESGEDPASGRGAQVHLALRPSAAHDVHWSNDAGPCEVWVDDATSWELERPDVSLPVPADQETSSEVRRVDFTVTVPREGATLSGTAFYYVCEGSSGACRFLAQDFTVALPSAR
jgi:hypothetical protein